MLKKAGKGIWEIQRQEDGHICIYVYDSQKDNTGKNKVDASGELIPNTGSYMGATGYQPQDMYDAFAFLFPEIVGKPSTESEAEFDKRVAEAVKRLAETDEDLIERIKNYTDNDTEGAS